MLKKIPDHIKAFILFLSAAFIYSVKVHIPPSLATQPVKEYVGYITIILVLLSVVIVADKIVSFFRKKTI